jgi:hypothetical protein
MEFGSPGAGDLSGAAGPLETWRKLRVDRDDRRKDREWREDQDRQEQEAEIELKRREQDRISAETSRIAAEATRAEAEADQARVAAFRGKYDLMADIYGVEAARRWAARELALSDPAIDALSRDLDAQPVLLEPPAAAPEESE